MLEIWKRITNGLYIRPARRLSPTGIILPAARLRESLPLPSGVKGVLAERRGERDGRSDGKARDGESWRARH